VKKSVVVSSANMVGQGDFYRTRYPLFVIAHYIRVVPLGLLEAGAWCARYKLHFSNRLLASFIPTLNSEEQQNQVEVRQAA